MHLSTCYRRPASRGLGATMCTGAGELPAGEGAQIISKNLRNISGKEVIS